LGKALSNARITLPESVLVEVLEDTFAFAKEYEESGLWPEAAATAVVDGETLPDWLQELGSSDAALTSEELRGSPATPAETIDWLDEVAVADIDESAVGQDDPLVVLDEDADDITSGAQLAATSGPEPSSTTVENELDDLLDDVLSTDAVEAAAGSDELAAVATQSTRSDAIASSAGSGGPSDDQKDLTSEDAGSEPPLWEDEQLLALDELKSFIDDDDQSMSASGSAPEWMDELADKTDVSDELPRWLHEAVGFEVASSDRADSTDRKPTDDNVTSSRDAVASTALDQGVAKHDQTDSDRQDDQGHDSLDSAVGELREPSAHSAVPDWLLEGEDVLEELPSGILSLSVEKEAADDRSVDDTMTWLDELSEQLADEDDSTSAEAPD
jgi:hypothetical protein